MRWQSPDAARAPAPRYTFGGLPHLPRMRSPSQPGRDEERQGYADQLCSSSFFTCEWRTANQTTHATAHHAGTMMGQLRNTDTKSEGGQERSAAAGTWGQGAEAGLHHMPLAEVEMNGNYVPRCRHALHARPQPAQRALSAWST